MSTPPALTLFERIAKVCHEANAAWTEDPEGGLPTTVLIAGWEQLSDVHRAAVVGDVQAVLRGGPNHLTVVPAGANIATEDVLRRRALFEAIVKTLGCGIERWAEKTGTDADADKVNMTAVASTIAELVAFPAPVQPLARVAGGPEVQLYTIDATVVACKMESDSDYHLALSDGQGHTMIAEAACPGCASGSPWLTQIQAVRAAIEAAIPNISGQFQNVGRAATITGPGFFDRLHGQMNVAPTGIELHPILAIEFH